MDSRRNENSRAFMPGSVNKRILVVDDWPDNIALFCMLLEMEGYEVETALSGEDCLIKVYERLPDLLVLDVMMPGMDGIAVTRHLRSDAHLPHFPVLLVTARTDLAGVGREVGADGLLHKPVEPDEFIRYVRLLLAAQRN